MKNFWLIEMLLALIVSNVFVSYGASPTVTIATPGAGTISNYFLTGTNIYIVVTDSPYLANGNDAEDDTAAIQAALIAAGTNSTVYFPRGTYLIDTNVSGSVYYCLQISTTNTGVRLLGDNATIKIADGSIARAGLRFTDSTGLGLTGFGVPDNITVEGITFDGNGANHGLTAGPTTGQRKTVQFGVGTATNPGTNIVIRNCIFKNRQAIDILFNCTDVTVEGCQFSGVATADQSGGLVATPPIYYQSTALEGKFRITKNTFSDIDGPESGGCQLLYANYGYAQGMVDHNYVTNWNRGFDCRGNNTRIVDNNFYGGSDASAFGQGTISHVAAASGTSSSTNWVFANNNVWNWHHAYGVLMQYVVNGSAHNNHFYKSPVDNATAGAVQLFDCKNATNIVISGNIAVVGNHTGTTEVAVDCDQESENIWVYNNVFDGFRSVLTFDDDSPAGTIKMVNNQILNLQTLSSLWWNNDTSARTDILPIQITTPLFASDNTGSTNDTFNVLFSTGHTLSGGSGAPSTTPSQGSIYLRSDGTGPNLYIYENGSWLARNAMAYGEYTTDYRALDRGTVWFNGTTAFPNHSRASVTNYWYVNTNAFAMAVTLRTDTLSRSNTVGIIGTSYSSNQAAVSNSLYMYITAGDIKVMLQQTNVNTLAYRRIVRADFLDDYPNETVTLVAVRRTNDCLLYINGALQTTTEESVAPVPDWNTEIQSDYFHVGVRGSTTTLIGEVDSAALFNFPLSQDDVIQYFKYGPSYQWRWCGTNDLSSGNLTLGKRYRITAQNGANFTADGAPSNDVGTEFIATAATVTLDANDTAFQLGAPVYMHVVNGTFLNENNKESAAGVYTVSGPTTLMLNDSGSTGEVPTFQSDGTVQWSPVVAWATPVAAGASMPTVTVPTICKSNVTFYIYDGSDWNPLN